MKVLWFTNTPSLASQYYGFSNTSGGWISSLESAIHENTDFKIAIAFFTESIKGSMVWGKTVYYPIHKNGNIIQKLFDRHFNCLNELKYLKHYLKIIDDFRPDIIQIFGTENGFSYLCGNTTLPVCIHLQGILTDCQHYFSPGKISRWDLLKYSSLGKILKGTSLLHVYWNLKKRAKRELRLFPLCHYYFGRTIYDKSFVENHAPSATYFNCNELLRKEFYQTKRWNYPKNRGNVLLTINNGEIYKGIDIILETASLLKKAGFSFEWRIAGVDQSNVVLNLFENKLKLSHNDLSINLLGELNADEIVDQMIRSDLFIHTSRIDNSPNSICEAMLVGMPVIAFNVGGISSLIDNRCGILINQVEPAALSKEIISALSNSDHLISIGKNARLIALERHNPTKLIDDIKYAYQKILQNE
jgi:glycosyltransferase involved in cell wall biosynthesis